MYAAPLVRNFQPLDTLESRLVQSLRDVTQAEHKFLRKMHLPRKMHPA